MEQTSRAHPRQRFYLYVPRSYDGRDQFRLLVVMHGAERRAEEYAEEFTAFADEHRYIILAPLFPRGERYQQLGIGDDDSIRADLRLLELVSEVGGRYRVETDRFDLFGFSGGGQFAHRFLYVHPDRLRSVVVAAPGTVALPTDRYRWPYGIADLGKLANVRFDLEKVRRVRALLIVGEEDVEDENLNESDEANRFGRTRLKRARTLHEAWQEAGIRHEYVEVADLGHELNGSIVRRAARFLAAGR
jgi:poly(3-hydroxybutyrate) depolymerase